MTFLENCMFYIAMSFAIIGGVGFYYSTEETYYEHDPCQKHGLVHSSTVTDMQVKPHQNHVRYVKFICKEK